MVLYIERRGDSECLGYLDTAPSFAVYIWSMMARCAARIEAYVVLGRKREG